MNKAIITTRPASLVSEVMLDTDKSDFAHRFEINPLAGWLLHILDTGFFMGPMGGFEIVGDVEVHDNVVTIRMNDEDYEHFEFLLMQNPLVQ